MIDEGFGTALWNESASEAIHADFHMYSNVLQCIQVRFVRFFHSN